MKVTCPRCQYEGFVDAASVSAGEEVICARCGGSLSQLLWSRSQPSSLTTAASAAQAAFVDQRIMENQNAYAPSAETGFEDVLDIPGPLRPAQQTTDQALVLEDVIPEQDLSAAAETVEPEMQPGDAPSAASDEFSEEGAHHISFDETTAYALEREWQGGPGAVGAAQVSAFDYEGNRAWLRVAPLLLLGAALVFFALYYLGNRVGSGGVGPKTQNDAVSPATPETQSATQESAPAAAESAPEASQTTGSTAGNAPITAESAPQAPEPESKIAEPARKESKPTTPTPAPPPAAATTTTTAPAAATAEQAAGNYTIQVGSYNDAAQANERAGRLRSNGVEARVVKVEIPRRGTWYRVQTGRFASHEEAARSARELKGKGATDDFIITDFQGQ